MELVKTPNSQTRRYVYRGGVVVAARPTDDNDSFEEAEFLVVTLTAPSAQGYIKPGSIDPRLSCFDSLFVNPKTIGTRVRAAVFRNMIARMKGLCDFLPGELPLEDAIRDCEHTAANCPADTPLARKYTQLAQWLVELKDRRQNDLPDTGVRKVLRLHEEEEGSRIAQEAVVSARHEGTKAEALTPIKPPVRTGLSARRVVIEIGPTPPMQLRIPPRR